MAILYRTKATVTGGRAGHAETADGTLKLDLGLPKELGGPGTPGRTNPEQLFACGYAACFGGAIEFAARQKKLNVPAVTVTCEVGIGPREPSGFMIEASLHALVPGVTQQQAEELAHEAHERICPYSHATRGNINVKVTAKAG